MLQHIGHQLPGQIGLLPLPSNQGHPRQQSRPAELHQGPGCRFIRPVWLLPKQGIQSIGYIRMQAVKLQNRLLRPAETKRPLPLTASSLPQNEQLQLGFLWGRKGLVTVDGVGKDHRQLAALHLHHIPVNLHQHLSLMQPQQLGTAVKMRREIHLPGTKSMSQQGLVLIKRNHPVLRCKK